METIPVTGRDLNFKEKCDMYFNILKKNYYLPVFWISDNHKPSIVSCKEDCVKLDLESQSQP